jgi:hypothetical protein
MADDPVTPEFQIAAAQTDDLVQLQIGGRLVPLILTPTRPNPTRWPPVVTYAIGNQVSGSLQAGLLHLDVRDLAVIGFGDVEGAADALASLPWQAPATLSAAFSDVAALQSLSEGLAARLGADAPLVEGLFATGSAAASEASDLFGGVISQIGSDLLER